MRRHTELSESVIGQLVAKPDDRSGTDDITHKIKMGVKTILSDRLELEAQRWYVESFTDDGFEHRRHECANAAIAVYGLSHASARELYDLTMLEVRRVLYDDVKPPKQAIAPGRLLGTRSAWMARYSNLMSSDEFTKFVVLMRNLALYVLLIVDPQNSSHRRDRCPQIGRKTLELILYGCPGAAPLFFRPRPTM